MEKLGPVVVILLDGYGYLPRTDGNAIAQAHPTHMEALVREFPSTTLVASGEAVGLPAGQMGNSEVGHLNIGAGRIVYQPLTRLHKAVKDGAFQRNEVLQGAIAHAKTTGGKLHLMGLLSDGGVHSHQIHLFALLAMAKDAGLDRVYVHAFLDGRDVPPTSADVYIRELEVMLAQNGGQLATITGRYYAMDRDNRWERTSRAYDAMVLGEGRRVPAAEALDVVIAARQLTDEGMTQTDEFLQPLVLTGADGQPLATIDDGDAVVHFNFRPDRANQMAMALTQDAGPGFDRRKRPKVHFVCMALYNEAFALPVAFPPQPMAHLLGEVVAGLGVKQFRCAETEKFRHVTSFFNGASLAPYPGEERELVDSPKVATYDLKPEMSAAGVTAAACKAIRSGQYPFVVINYANADMVGHTGKLDAAIKAVQACDVAVGEVVKATREMNGVFFITADHGNAEQMVDFETGQPHTAHTANPVPAILGWSDPQRTRLRPDGILADVAPTLLQVMGLPVPAEMDGRSLITPDSPSLAEPRHASLQA